MKAKKKRKRREEEEDKKVWILVRISMIFDFEYRIMCILDFGRDFYGFQT